MQIHFRTILAFKRLGKFEQVSSKRSSSIQHLYLPDIETCHRVSKQYRNSLCIVFRPFPKLFSVYRAMEAGRRGKERVLGSWLLEYFSLINLSAGRKDHPNHAYVCACGQALSWTPAPPGGRGNPTYSEVNFWIFSSSIITMLMKSMCHNGGRNNCYTNNYGLFGLGVLLTPRRSSWRSGGMVRLAYIDFTLIKEIDRDKLPSYFDIIRWSCLCS